jgi:hypothetical protein
MLKDMSWYLEDNQFTNLTKELKTCVEIYGNAKASHTNEKELTHLREHARELFEEHCVKSGLREKNASYINIDREFFDKNNIDEEALGTFIKNIVKGHCYQKNLWMYMGTTGTYSVISKNEMKNQGQRYENYLPITYKENHPEKISHIKQLEENVIPIFMYNDGTVSSQYDTEKAKFRFDALEDRSGIHWQKNYDPNDSVKKEKWFGEYDASGIWVKVQEQEENKQTEEQKNFKEIKIIKDGDSAILYDPGMILLNPEYLLYLTEEGEEYGNLEMDIEKTLEVIRKKLSSLGVKHIRAVSIPHGEDKKILEQYQDVLKNLAHKNLCFIDAADLNIIITKEKEVQKKCAEEAIGIEIESIIRAVPMFSMTERASVVSRSVTERMVTVPLLPMNPQDGEILGLSKTEIDAIAKLNIPAENKKSFHTALSNVYAGWPAYSGNGVNKIQLAEMIQHYYENKKQLQDTIITAETNLESLFSEPKEKDENGFHIYVPNIPGEYEQPETIDFYEESTREQYLQKLEKQGQLPQNGAAAAKKIFQEKLSSDSIEINKEKINRFITCGLKEYQTIRMNCGMTIQEVIETAIAFANDSNFTENPALASLLKKKISYELPLAKLIESASKENYQTKKRSVTSILYNMKKREKAAVVIGGNTGKSLAEYGFDFKTLETQYSCGKQTAFEIAAFLENIRMNENTDNEIVSKIKSIIETKQSFNAAKKSIIEYLETQEGTAFNVKSDEGFSAYKMSNRYKASGLNHEQLTELVTQKDITQNVAMNTISLLPKYRDTGNVVALNRKIQNDLPEKITQKRMIPKRSKKSGNKNLEMIVPLKSFDDDQTQEQKAAALIKRNGQFLQNNYQHKNDLAKNISSGFDHVPNKTMNHIKTISAHFRQESNNLIKSKAENSETMRLQKIEAEYEKEKAEWEKKKQPILARSASHALSHAEGVMNPEPDDPKKVGAKMFLAFKEKLL